MYQRVLPMDCIPSTFEAFITYRNLLGGYDADRSISDDDAVDEKAVSALTKLRNHGVV